MRDTGSSFVPVRFHPGSILSIYTHLHDTIQTHSGMSSPRRCGVGSSGRFSLDLSIGFARTGTFPLVRPVKRKELQDKLMKLTLSRSCLLRQYRQRHI